MYKKFKENIKTGQLAAPGDAVIVALSGGADSVCLLYLMKRYSEETGIRLGAIHVNHMLRGDDSNGDEGFCVALCEKLGIPIDVYRKDVGKFAAENKMTIEEAGRAVRYDIFEKADADKIAIAHNMDDNAETVMINLLRGAGAAGLSGISKTNERYIRPLMIFRKSEILGFCSSEGIEYRTDKSNEDTSYFRNSVRHRLIPLMDEITGRDTVPLINRTASMISEDESYLDFKSDEAFSECASTDEYSVTMDNEKFIALHPAIAARVIRKAYQYVAGTLKDFENKNTTALMEMIAKGKTGDSMDLSSGISALVQFGETILQRANEQENYEYTLEVPGRIYIRERNITLSCEVFGDYPGVGEEGFICIADTGHESMIVRNRRDGDRFSPAKGNGTKKLKKYFIDRKIHRMERNKVFLLLIGGKIAYIEGMDHGKGFIPEKGRKYTRISIERGKQDV